MLVSAEKVGMVGSLSLFLIVRPLSLSFPMVLSAEKVGTLVNKGCPVEKGVPPILNRPVMVASTSKPEISGQLAIIFNLKIISNRLQ